MSEEKKDFVVKDRRIFSQEASEQPEKKESRGVEEKPAPKEPEEKTQEEKPAGHDDKTQPQLPEINFQTFIFSLNASALVQLGVMDDPATGKKEKNLPMAKQTIDMLSMLHEKTAGNLLKEEDELLKHILYDLRLRYVKEKG
jgi:hypothetical protein